MNNKEFAQRIEAVRTKLYKTALMPPSKQKHTRAAAAIRVCFLVCIYNHITCQF